MMTDADYTVDLAIITNHLKEAGILLYKLEQVASKINLYINALLKLSIWPITDGALYSLTWEQIKSVKDFKYLGS